MNTLKYNTTAIYFLLSNLLITNALVIPRGMSVPAYLATRLNYWEGQYASTGFSNKRLKGIHVLDHYISMEEYEANRDAR